MVRFRLRPHHKAPASYCLGTASGQAKAPRRLARGVAPLLTVVLLLALAPTASATIQFERQWGGSGSGDGQFGSSPQGVETSPSGNVYVADADNDRIQKFD